MPQKAHANKGFARKDRIAEQVRRELSEIIARELKDPRVGMISLTEVSLTADYAHAKVYFSTLAAPENLPEIERGLAQAALFLRRELGKRIHIHTLPQLHFIHDNSLVYGAELTRLIDAAVSLSNATAADSE